MDKQNTGKFLKELRIEKGLTQTEFSEQLSKFCGIDAYGGFSCAAISKWERGEALPDLYNLKDIAKFYGVTVDEILEGCRHVSIDYNEMYFGEFDRKERERRAIGKNTEQLRLENIYCEFDKSLVERNADVIGIQMRAEARYRRLITDLARNVISRADEDEFDFLCLSYFKQYYCFENGKRVAKPFAADALKFMKVDVKKYANSLGARSDEELLFEINRRYCVCNFMPMQYVSGVHRRFESDDLQALDIVEYPDFEPIYHEFVKSLSPWDKDALLSVVLEDIYRYDDEDFDIEEYVTKRFIKMLINCGATVNNAIKYRRVVQNKPRYIVQELAEIYSEFCAPTAVYDTTKKQFVEAAHVHGVADHDFIDELKAEYAELEKRLLAGETELERQYSVVRGKSIYDVTYAEFVRGRDELRTDELYKSIDRLSVEQIKNDFFTEKE